MPEFREQDHPRNANGEFSETGDVSAPSHLSAERKKAWEAIPEAANEAVAALKAAGIDAKISKSSLPHGRSFYVKVSLGEHEVPLAIRISDHGAWVPRQHQREVANVHISGDMDDAQIKHEINAAVEKMKEVKSKEDKRKARTPEEVERDRKLEREAAEHRVAARKEMLSVYNKAIRDKTFINKLAELDKTSKGRAIEKLKKMKEQAVVDLYESL